MPFGSRRRWREWLCIKRVFVMAQCLRGELLFGMRWFAGVQECLDWECFTERILAGLRKRKTFSQGWGSLEGPRRSAVFQHSHSSQCSCWVAQLPRPPWKYTIEIFHLCSRESGSFWASHVICNGHVKSHQPTGVKANQPNHDCLGKDVLGRMRSEGCPTELDVT